MDLGRYASVLAVLSACMWGILLNGNAQRSNGPRLEWSLGPCILQVYESCNNAKIRFLLYNKGEEPVQLQAHNPQPPSGKFNPNLPTKVIIHGYAGHAEFNTTAVIRRAYLDRGGSNLIVVDWGPLANHPCFLTAIFNVWQVGTCTSQLLVGLATKFPLRASNIHAIGFSLGAHVASIASNGVRGTLGSRFGRITGLDPALPLFATLNDKWKLDAEDADFVDAIHTNAGVFGKVETVGNVDFFMNGGSIQPACAGHKNVPLCSHLLAPVYFAESINTDIGFWGAPCPSIWYLLMGWCNDKDVPEERKILMGEHCDTGNRGIFYLDTSDTPPYALGKRRHTLRRRYSQTKADKKTSSSDVCLSHIFYF